MSEFRKALDDAQPRWAKIYMGIVGLPAWAYLAYRTASSDSFDLGRVGYVALAAFISAAALQIVLLFRAFWRNDI